MSDKMRSFSSGASICKNDTAPIFEIADYGICGDLFKVTPMLIEAFKAAKAAK